MISLLSRDQKNAIISGREWRKQMENVIEEVCNFDEKPTKRHAYIGGTAGFGKSHTVREKASEAGVPVKLVKGQTSLFGLAQSLAVLKATHGNDPVIVIVDDCDKLFSTEESINAMKAVLEEGFTDDGEYKGEFKYEKNIHLNSVPEGIKRDCMELFMNDDESGFRIGLSNFRFLVTSNNSLPSLKTIRVQNKRLKDKKLEKTANLKKAESKYAIRSRCQYINVDATLEDVWGGFASILLEDTERPEVSKEEKTFILNWLWSNREDCNEFDYRQVLSMCDDIVKLGPEQCMDRWEFRYLD